MCQRYTDLLQTKATTSCVYFSAVWQPPYGYELLWVELAEARITAVPNLTLSQQRLHVHLLGSGL